MKKIRVTVGDKTFEVTVEILSESTLASPAHRVAPVSSADVPVQAPTAPVSIVRPPASGDGSVTSPLGGKVASIEVKPGARVQEGDQLMAIEAMKMNTYIYAPISGIVAEILVAPGEGVDEGTLLLRIT